MIKTTSNRCRARKVTSSSTHNSDKNAVYDMLIFLVIIALINELDNYNIIKNVLSCTRKILKNKFLSLSLISKNEFSLTLLINFDLKNVLPSTLNILKENDLSLVILINIESPTHEILSAMLYMISSVQTESKKSIKKNVSLATQFNVLIRVYDCKIRFLEKMSFYQKSFITSKVSVLKNWPALATLNFIILK